MTYRPKGVGDWAAAQAYMKSIPWWQKAFSPVPAIKAAALLLQPAKSPEEQYGVVPLPPSVNQPSATTAKIPWVPISVGAGLLAVVAGYLYYNKKRKKVVAAI